MKQDSNTVTTEKQEVKLLQRIAEKPNEIIYI